MPRYKGTVEFRISVAVEPDEKGFHAYCPALKGLHTYGDTEKEALENASAAAAAYLESLIKHKDPIPVGVVTSQGAKGIMKKRVKPHLEDLTIACAI